MGEKTDRELAFAQQYVPTDPRVKALVFAAEALLEGDDPCPECHEEPGEGEGLCSEGCSRNSLVIALRPFSDLEGKTQ